MYNLRLCYRIVKDNFSSIREGGRNDEQLDMFFRIFKCSQTRQSWSFPTGGEGRVEW